ncbi:hypothetical protein MTO96_041463 [Rhipicephalus appendiculatus]
MFGSQNGRRRRHPPTGSPRAHVAGVSNQRQSKARRVLGTRPASITTSRRLRWARTTTCPTTSTLKRTLNHLLFTPFLLSHLPLFTHLLLLNNSVPLTANPPPNNTNSRLPASTSSGVGQSAVKLLLCGLLLFVVLLLFSMAIMFAYALAGKRSVARNERTQDDYEGTATRREDDDGHSGRRAGEVATTPVSAAGVAPAARRQREKSGQIGRNS